MRPILILILWILVSGCETTGGRPPLCEAAMIATNQASKAVASVLECEAPEAIAKTIQSVVENTGICQPKETKVVVSSLALSPMGLIGNIVCPPVGRIIVKLAAKQLPEDWECSAEVAKDKLKDLIVRGCKLVIDKV